MAEHAPEATIASDVHRGGRDRFLDSMRAIAILRVVGVHLAGATSLLWWPAPTLVLPGMPIVFFISGALTLRSFSSPKQNPQRFWKDRLRRLLVPYWAYLAAISMLALIFDALTDQPKWTVDHSAILANVIPFRAVPLSRGAKFMTGHLWFMSCFLVLTLAAPALVRLHRRWPRGLLLGALAFLLGVQALDLLADWTFWREFDRLSLFAGCYIVGFSYRATSHEDRRRFMAAAAVLAILAAAYMSWDATVVNASEISHALVGGAWLCVALAWRDVVERVASDHSGLLDRVTKRTFTLYLWGWPSTGFANRIADRIDIHGWARTGFVISVSIAFLALFTTLFGRFEDLAAKRRPATQSARASAMFQ